jgi:hypothetical protein
MLKQKDTTERGVCARVLQINSFPALSSFHGRDGFGKCVWPVRRFDGGNIGGSGGVKT